MKEWVVFHLSEFLVDSVIAILGVIISIVISILLTRWPNNR